MSNPDRSIITIKIKVEVRFELQVEIPSPAHKNITSGARVFVLTDNNIISIEQFHYELILVYRGLYKMRK